MTILTSSQYEAAKSLLKTMGKLGFKSLTQLNVHVIEEEGPNWELCDYCAEIRAECRCDDDGSMHGRYYAEYDDEASYE